MASNFLKKKASEQAARTAEKFAANSSGGVKTVGENTGVKSEGGVKPSSTKSRPVTKVSSFLQKKASEQAARTTEQFGENAYGGTKWRENKADIQVTGSKGNTAGTTVGAAVQTVSMRAMADQAEKAYNDYINSDDYRKNYLAAAQSFNAQHKWDGLKNALPNAVFGAGGFGPAAEVAVDPKERELKSVWDYYKVQAQLEADKAVMEAARKEWESWDDADREALELYTNNRLGSLGNIAQTVSAISSGSGTQQGQAAIRAGQVNAAYEQLAQKYGADRVKQLAESYERYQNRQTAEEVTAGAREAANGDGTAAGKWLAGAANSLAARGANVVGAIAAPVGLLSEVTHRTGQYSTLDPNNLGNIYHAYAGAVDAQNAENISGDKYDILGNKVSDGGWARQAGATLYEAGMSAADSFARILASGGSEAISLGLAATGSFGSTVSEASKLGANPAQALALGIVSGGLEVLTEKVSLDNLFKEAAAGPKTFKQVLKGILKSGAIEVSEEELSFLGSTIAEAAILQEKSDYNQKVQRMVVQGKSIQEAEKTVMLDLLQEAAMTAVQSFLSGGMMGGGAQIVNAHRTNEIGKMFAQADLDKADVQDLIDSGLESAPDTESYQIAREIQQQIQNGQTPSNYDLARLWQANQQAIAEEKTDAGAELPDPDAVAQKSNGVTGNTQNVTAEGQNVTADGQNVTAGSSSVAGEGVLNNRTTAPLGVAAQIRNGQTLNGGRINGTEQTGADERTGLLSGGGQRHDGTGTGEQTGSLAGRTGQAAQRRQQAFEQQRAALDRRNRFRSLPGQKVSSAELGLQRGTNSKNLRQVPREYWDGEMNQLAERVYQESGKAVSFVTGNIQIRGEDGGIRNVNGVVYGDQVVIRADHTRLSPEQIVDHEMYHGRVEQTDGWQPNWLNGQIREYIVERFSEEEFREVLTKYMDALRGIYEEDDPQFRQRIEEEVFADAYAGINAFGAGADRFTSAVNEKMEQLGLNRYRGQEQENGVRETAGPPDVSIEKENTADDGGERYSVDERFASMIDSWDGKTIGFSFVVGETSEALQEAGIPKKQIRWDASKIKTLLEKHNGMTLDTVKQIPELLEHPIVVIESKKGSNSKIVMGDLYDDHGKIVTAVLLLTPTSKKGNVLDILKISSAEGRSHIKSLFTAEDGSLVPVRYTDKKRIRSWLNVNRLQLPLHNLDSDSDIIIDDAGSYVKNQEKDILEMTDEEFEARYALRLPTLDEVMNSADSQTFGSGRGGEVYSVDDGEYVEEQPEADSEAQTAEFARLKSEMQSQGKYWDEAFLMNRLGEEGYEQYRKWDREQEAQRKAQSKARAKERSTDRKAARKTADKPVAESRPTIAKRELRQTIHNIFSIPEGSRAELGGIIDSYADRLIKNGTLTEDDRRTFFARMYDAGVMTVPADDYFSTGRDLLRGGRIYVPESVREDFGDDWASLRRRAFSAGIYFTTDRSASGIDSWNHELAEELPGLFNSEETDLRSVLERIVDIAEEGKDEKMSLADYTAMLAGQDYVSEREFLDNMERQMDWALRTFAEKARLEVKLRDRTGVQIAKERAANQDAAQRQKDRKELRELQEKTLKSLRWLNQNRNRAPEELREEFEKVLGDIDLYAIGAANEMKWSDRYNATWKDLAQMYKDAQEHDPNFMPSKELEMIVGRLDGTKIEDLDLGALNDLYKAAVGLRTEFYNRNNVISDEMNRLFEEVYKDAKSEIQSAPGGYTGKAMDKLFNLEQLTPMNVLQRMGGWDPNGAFYSMAKQLEKGERDMRAYSVKAQRMLQEFLTEHEDWVKKADGQGKDGIWYEVQIPELIALELGKKPQFGGNHTVWMTPMQKVHMYLESKNVDNLRHMTGGRTFADKKLYSEGKRQEALSQGKTIRMAPETVKAMVADLTAEEMELARLLEQYYNSFATKEINRVSNILYGYDKAMGKNYAPIYTNRNYTKSEFGVFDVTAEGVGNLKGRQYAVNPSYNISAIDAFERHVDQTARFVGMAIPARNWTTLMNWREQRNSTGDVLTHKWGEESKRYITDLINNLQAGEDFKSDMVSSAVSKLQSTYITSIFGANPSIVLKQLGSIPLASAYLDAKNVPTPAQIRSIDRELIGRYSQDLAWRTMGYTTPETRQLKENPNWTQTNKFYKFTFGGGAITAMDGWAASVLWPWAENKVRADFPDLEVGTQQQVDQGESPFYKKVAELFEEALSRSQSVSDEIHQSSLRKSKNPVTKAFTMFRSDSAQTYNTLRQKIGEAQYFTRTGAKEQVQKAAKKAVGAAFVSLLMNAMWSESISFLMALWKNKGKYYRDEEDELTFGSVAAEMASGILGSFAGIVTGGEELLEVIGNVLTGEKIYDIETPGIEQLNDLITAVSSAGGNMRDVIGGAVNVAVNGGNVWKYFGQNSGKILSSVKDLAETTVMYLPGLTLSGLPVSNIEGYLLGAVKWLSPELGEAYDNLFQDASRSKLAGAKGRTLDARVEDLLKSRKISSSDETARVLADLYEAGYKAAVPSDAPGSVSIKGENHTLNAYQRQAYDTVWSGIVKTALDGLIDMVEFTSAEPKEQAKILNRLYDYAAEQAKAELFPEYQMENSAKNMAKIHAAGLDLADCIAWAASTADMKKAEKFHELRTEKMPDAVKKVIVGTLIGTDMKTESGKESQYAKMLTALKQGATVDEYLDMRLDGTNVDDFLELVEGGMDDDIAVDLLDAIADIEPESGKNTVSDVAKWRACVDFTNIVDNQLTALFGIMKIEQYQKVEIANDFGVNPDMYVTLQEIQSQHDADGNRSYTNAEIQAAVEAMPGKLTSAQKAVLWQLATGSISARNNPFDRAVGQKVLDAKAAAKEKYAE